MIYLAASHVAAAIQASYLMGGAVLVICLIRLDIALTPIHLFWLAADLWSIFDTGGGLCIYSGSCLLDWGERGLYRLLYKNLTEFIQYPLSVYHRGIRELLTFVLPYAFINYYPYSISLTARRGSVREFCGI